MMIWVSLKDVFCCCSCKRARECNQSFGIDKQWCSNRASTRFRTFRFSCLFPESTQVSPSIQFCKVNESMCVKTCHRRHLSIDQDFWKDHWNQSWILHSVLQLQLSNQHLEVKFGLKVMCHTIGWSQFEHFCFMVLRIRWGWSGESGD